MEAQELLAEQATYYRERAPEYDDWWFRRGRYDGGRTENQRWFDECAEVEAALEAFAPRGRVLELACGTGLWTRHLARHADHLTAVDQSPEVLALNRARLGDARVEYVEADVFAWRPQEPYDVCVFGFWLSHVPEPHFDAFWDGVRESLVPGGRFFVVDSDRGDGIHSRSLDDEIELRRLADGRAYRIVKRYYEARELERRLSELGWTASVSRTAGGSLLYAGGTRN